MSGFLLVHIFCYISANQQITMSKKSIAFIITVASIFFLVAFLFNKIIGFGYAWYTILIAGLVLGLILNFFQTAKSNKKPRNRFKK